MNYPKFPGYFVNYRETKLGRPVLSGEGQNPDQPVGILCLGLRRLFRENQGRIEFFGYAGQISQHIPIVIEGSPPEYYRSVSLFSTGTGRTAGRYPQRAINKLCQLCGKKAYWSTLSFTCRRRSTRTMIIHFCYNCTRQVPVIHTNYQTKCRLCGRYRPDVKLFTHQVGVDLFQVWVHSRCRINLHKVPFERGLGWHDVTNFVKIEVLGGFE